MLQHDVRVNFKSTSLQVSFWKQYASKYASVVVKNANAEMEQNALDYANTTLFKYYPSWKRCKWF